MVKSLIARIQIRKLRENRIAEEKRKEEELKESFIQEAGEVIEEEYEEDTEEIIGEFLLTKLLDEEGKQYRQNDVEGIESDFMEVENEEGKQEK